MENLQKLWAFRLNTFFFEITSRIVEFGGFPDCRPFFFFLISSQGLQTFVERQENGGKLYFLHLARGKRDKKKVLRTPGLKKGNKKMVCKGLMKPLPWYHQAPRTAEIQI